MSTQRRIDSMSLTCAASRNFSPPYFTNGMLRLVSSTSSTSLWCELRNKIAWRLQRAADLARGEDLADDVFGLRLCIVQRHVIRLLRRLPHAHQRLAVLARPSDMSALAASRMGWVER